MKTTDLPESTSSELPQSDISKLPEMPEQPIDVRSVALTGLFIFASIHILIMAKAFFLPIAFSLVLSFLLQPLIRVLKNVWIPESIGAAIVLLATGGLVVYSLSYLATPAADWLTKAPEALHVVETKLRAIKNSVIPMTQATEAIEKITDLNGNPPARQLVELKGPGLEGTLIGVTTDILAAFIATAILLYFLLASGDLFLEKLVKVLPTFSDKRRAVEIVRDIEKNISTHLVTVTCINSVLGTAIALSMYWMGMPNPILWGVMGAILNFVPYVGSIIGIGVIILAAALTFEQLSTILLVGLAYGVLTAIEGSFVTPMILGRRLTLNPVVVLLSVFFWGWIWGVPGALLAVPIVAALKIICDHLDPLASVGEFLGR